MRAHQHGVSTRCSRKRSGRRLSALLALGLVGSCAAPTTGGEGAGPDILDPGPDFGYIPNATGIVQPGRTYLETAALLGHGPESGQRASSLPALVRAGVAEDWEVRVQTWLLQVDEDAHGTTTGLGPLEVGFKHRLSRGDARPLAPAYGFEVEVLLPVSSGGFDDGKLGLGAWTNVDHTTSEHGLFTWNAGFETPVDVDGDPFLQGYLAWAYSHFVTPVLQLYATGSGSYPAPTGDGSLAVLGAGLYWYFSRRAVLVTGYNAGLMSQTPDGLFTLGLSFAF